MKKIRLIAAFGAFSILSGCMDLSEITENKIDPPKPPVSDIMPQVTNVCDEFKDSEWYDMLCENLLQGKKRTIVPVKIGNSDVKKALTQIETDFPQIFWIGKNYYAVTVTDGSEIDIEFLNDFEADDIPKMLQELEEAADKVISEIPKGSSDYEKVLYVHDYIIENTEYDDAGAASSEFGLWGSSYGCLVEGKAVCAGYAEAFHYIMQKLDIESGICSGSNHEWNYVNIDGEYYWLDATWDDADKGDPQHTYFLFTTEQLLRTRTFDLMQSCIPECTSIDSNYFEKNGGYFETFDEAAVLEYIGSCSDEYQCEMMFGSFEVYEEALNSLLRKGALRKADGIDMESMRYYRNDNMFGLDIIF